MCCPTTPPNRGSPRLASTLLGDCGVVRQKPGHVVEQTSGPHQSHIEARDTRLESLRQSLADSGDSSAVRHHVGRRVDGSKDEECFLDGQGRFLAKRPWGAPAGRRVRVPAVEDRSETLEYPMLLRCVHIHEHGEVPHVHVGLVLGESAQKGLQSAASIGLQEGANVTHGEKGRVSAAAAAGGIDDAFAAPVKEVTHQTQDSRRHERTIDRQNEEGVGVSPQPGDPCLHGGEHPGFVVRVVDGIDLEAAENREERFRIVPGHYDHLPRSRCAERGDHPLDRRHPAHRQQGLARPHPRRASRGKDYRGRPPRQGRPCILCPVFCHEGDCSRQLRPKAGSRVPKRPP